MRVLTVSSLALAAVLMLGACSNDAETSAAGTSAAPASTQAAADLEHPRPGLWEQRMSNGSSAAFAAKFCIGEPEPGDNPFATGATGSEDGDCTVDELRRTADGLHFRSVCRTSEGGTLSSEGQVTGDLKTAYRVDVSIKLDGAPVAPGMPTESRVVVEARRLGDCPAGVEPGDIVP